MDQHIEKQIEKRVARRVAKWVAIGVAGIVGITIFIFLGGKVVQLLWNWLLPPLFGFPMVSFWQALGLLLLSRILFGGLGRGGHRGARGMRFSREDKERFRDRMRERWSRDAGPAAP
jgi:hypothetical protein